MMYGPYWSLSRVYLEVVNYMFLVHLINFSFEYSIIASDIFKIPTLLLVTNSDFFVLNLEPNTSSPLNTQAASLWSNQEGIKKFLYFDSSGIFLFWFEFTIIKCIHHFAWSLLQNTGKWWRSCTSLLLLSSLNFGNT